MDQCYLQQLCVCCMNKYVGIRMSDNQAFDGFIAHVDQDSVILAVPTEEMEDRLSGSPTDDSTYRQFGFHPGFFPRRRFFFRRFPFGGIGSLFLLPFFI